MALLPPLPTGPEKVSRTITKAERQNPNSATPGVPVDTENHDNAEAHEVPPGRAVICPAEAGTPTTSVAPEELRAASGGVVQSLPTGADSGARQEYRHSTTATLRITGDEARTEDAALEETRKVSQGVQAENGGMQPNKTAAGKLCVMSNQGGAGDTAVYGQAQLRREEDAHLHTKRPQWAQECFAYLREAVHCTLRELRKEHGAACSVEDLKDILAAAVHRSAMRFKRLRRSGRVSATNCAACCSEMSARKIARGRMCLRPLAEALLDGSIEKAARDMVH